MSLEDELFIVIPNIHLHVSTFMSRVTYDSSLAVWKTAIGVRSIVSLTSNETTHLQFKYRCQATFPYRLELEDNTV